MKMFYLHCSCKRVVEKINKREFKSVQKILCQINQETLKA